MLENSVAEKEELTQQISELRECHETLVVELTELKGMSMPAEYHRELEYSKVMTEKYKEEVRELKMQMQ